MDRSPPAGGQQCKEANKWASFRAATKETPPQAILLPHSQSGINALRLCSQVLSATKLRTFHLLRIWTETEGTAATPFFSSFFFREIQSNSVARVRKLRMTRQEKPFPLCPTKVELPRGNEEGRKEGKRGDWPPPLIPRAVASSSSVARGNGDQRKRRREKGPIHPLQSGAPVKHSGGGGGPSAEEKRASSCLPRPPLPHRGPFSAKEVAYSLHSLERRRRRGRTGPFPVQGIFSIIFFAQRTDLAGLERRGTTTPT